MPWRLIVFIAVFAVFLVFIAFNLENKCDISFGFAKLSDVPVFITIFTSFVLGLLCALPLVFHIKKRKELFKKPKIEMKPFVKKTGNSPGGSPGVYPGVYPHDGGNGE